MSLFREIYKSPHGPHKAVVLAYVPALLISASVPWLIEPRSLDECVRQVGTIWPLLVSAIVFQWIVFAFYERPRWERACTKLLESGRLKLERESGNIYYGIDGKREHYVSGPNTLGILIVVSFLMLGCYPFQKSVIASCLREFRGASPDLFWSICAWLMCIFGLFLPMYLFMMVFFRSWLKRSEQPIAQEPYL